MYIESSKSIGNGKIEITGSLGKVNSFYKLFRIYNLFFKFIEFYNKIYRLWKNLLWLV